MADFPLNHLDLVSASLAEDLGYVALGDLSIVLSDVNSRLIGGHTVSLHGYRWGLDIYRETLDVDIDLAPVAVVEMGISARLRALGYDQVAGGRFARNVPELDNPNDDARAVIDVLVPAYTNRARSDVSIGEEIVTTEVQGLAEALQRPPVDLSLSLETTAGLKTKTTIAVADELSALVLKAMVRNARNDDRDAVDLWRCLEICRAAGIRPPDFAGSAAQRAKRILASEFGPSGGGIAEIRRARGLSEAGTQALHTRIRALLVEVAGVRGDTESPTNP